MRGNRNQAGQIRVGFLQGNPRFQPCQAVEMKVAKRGLAAIDLSRHENINIRTIEEHEILRQNADDFMHRAIELKSATDYRSIASKMPLPETESKNDCLRHIRRVIPLAERPSEGGLNAESRQRTIRHFQTLNLFRLRAARNVKRQEVIQADVFEGLTLFPVDEVEILRHIDFGDIDRGSLVPNANEAVGLLVWEGLEQDAFDHAEDHGIGSGANRQGDKNDSRKQPRAAEAAKNLLSLALQEPHKAPLINLEVAPTADNWTNPTTCNPHTTRRCP